MNVIMCCSSLDTKGGMVSVTKNYLNYKWDNSYRIKFIPTHFDSNKWIVMAYFAVQFVKIWLNVLFGRFDIAHLHTAERGSFWRKRFLMNFFHKHGIKVVLHHHAAEFEEFYANCSEKQKSKVCKTLAEADVNIVLSERLISMIKDKETTARVEVLYNAVSIYPENPYSMKARNVLFLGRLGVRKGVFDLLEAIKRLDDSIPCDVQFYLCGDVGEGAVRTKVRELGIEHRIAHIGWVDGNKKNEFLRNTMINCLPSYNEGLPMTILETMAAGIPNISTNIASIPEVIKDCENGFLIKPGDVDKLVVCLRSLILDEKLRIKFSNNSYNLITHTFSIENNILKLQNIYRSICK